MCVCVCVWGGVVKDLVGYIFYDGIDIFLSTGHWYIYEYDILIH